MTAAAPVAAPQTAARPAAALAWQVASGLLFVGMTAVIKHAGADVPAAQSAFLRFAFGMIFVIPVLPLMWRHWPDRRIGGLLALRGGLHAVAVSLWFFALTSIPLAEVTAINYLNPVFVMLGATLVFGERLSGRRMAAAGLAVVGALIVLRPGFRELLPGHIAMLFMTAFMASAYLVVKRLSSALPAAVIVAWLTVAVTLMLAPPAILAWRPVGPEALGWFFVSAALATAAHYSMTRAFALAPLGVTQPAAFLQLLWSVTIGLALFSETPDPLVILGGLVIFVAVSWTSIAELRRAPG